MTPTTPEKVYRPDIERPPWRIAALPVCPDRKFPVPWFVAWVDGKPEFRGMDPEKMVRAIREKLCWVCGQPLGRNLTFVIGPMCSINRISAEPPNHLECAQYAAVNCPFLSKPHMVRREDERMEAMGVDPPGGFIKRNPGVTALWTCREFTTFREGRGLLFKVGDPTAVVWYREGRAATRAECAESIRTGLPKLIELCQGEEELAHLKDLTRKAEVYLPA